MSRVDTYSRAFVTEAAPSDVFHMTVERTGVVGPYSQFVTPDVKAGKTNVIKTVMIDQRVVVPTGKQILFQLELQDTANSNAKVLAGPALLLTETSPLHAQWNFNQVGDGLQTYDPNYRWALKVSTTSTDPILDFVALVMGFALPPTWRA